ncbi:subtilisin-like protease SBT4.15 [Andrographis paniculata]|uniref:subtilisin-like protease SBT4.15 n=1 Tax=Andrographis paniculata TaxID=175694 RepID=UPI0021E93210|nr:subtilisin-like protease SBT4.15 [Andrographis paniculata]
MGSRVMKLSQKLPFLATFLCICLNTATITIASSANERQVYIVYMGEVQEERTILMDAHHSLLTETIGDEKIARDSKIHSYGRSFNGFAARLLPHEAELLSKKEGVISVFPNRVQHLLTTRSWDFIGVRKELKRNYLIESNIIVGLLDTGVWIESKSFNDKGLGPPPRKWKGTCVKGVNFTGCNKKVIGAQYFDINQRITPEEATPVDTEGHGTHTASTAAGIAVEGASLYGIGEGTARGGVPSARIASYKVCWGIGCEDVNILAGFDAAIDDGVDIISASIGGMARSLTQDPIAIGSFHAAKKGILTVCAGGNEGPDMETIQNVAPWILTVAASTTDRRLEAIVKLGNGDTISGMAINTYEPQKEFYPLTSGAHAGNVSGDILGNVSACDIGTLSADKVKGKIVFCQGAGSETIIQDLGGIGTIMTYNDNPDFAAAPATMGSYVSFGGGQRIEKYINSTSSAQAVIYKTRAVNAVGPAIASFSSRGPQALCPAILKPDLAAPGVNILAAYSGLTTLTGQEDDQRVVDYNIASGTSMACPHVSGAAAFVKSFHPNWSPAAIKSALMTTTKRMKIKPVGAELASGSGLIRPMAALHPGLVYDVDTTSYLSYLCKQGYKDSDIALLMGSKSFNCSNIPQAKGADGLNYPSMHVQVNSTESTISATFYREVTNVGFPISVYKATVKPPKGLSISVTPDILIFNHLYQKLCFKVTVTGGFSLRKSWYLSGSLTWTDFRHRVRSPIFVSPYTTLYS